MYTHWIRTKQYNAYIPTEYEQMNEKSNVMHTYWIRTKQYCNVPTHWIQTKEYCSVPTAYPLNTNKRIYSLYTHWIRTKQYNAYPTQTMPTHWIQTKQYNACRLNTNIQCLPTECNQMITMPIYPLNTNKVIDTMLTHWIRTKQYIAYSSLLTECKQTNTINAYIYWIIIRTKQYDVLRFSLNTDKIIYCIPTEYGQSNTMPIPIEYEQNNIVSTHWIRTDEYEQSNEMHTHWMETKQYNAYTHWIWTEQ